MRTRRIVLWCAIILLANVAWFQSRGILSLSIPNTAHDDISDNRIAIKAKSNQQTATFAGGCFWSLDAMFRQLRGVSSVEPGYAGGTSKLPTYTQVCNGTSGHAESINIVFDPQIVSYRELLEVFFAVHNPTTPNQQGNDVGPQYRSMVFAHNLGQRETAMRAKSVAASTWSAPVVTQIVPFSGFARAEKYHLDYYNRQPLQGYNFLVVRPKIAKFRAQFAAKVQS